MLHLLTALLTVTASAQTLEKLGPYGTNADRIKDPNKWIAVIGDSVTTAAASGDGIQATIPSLRNVFSDFFSSQRFAATRAVKESPTRIFYSAAEFDTVAWYSKILKNFAAKAALRLDSPESSFAFRVGRSWGVHPSDIVLVGQDGAQVSGIPWQLARIFEMKLKVLPPVVIVSYTANDLCDVEIFNQPLEDVLAQFEVKLSRAWSQSAKFLRPSEGGTDFIVLAPLDVTQLITNGEIQTKSISFEGKGTVTCQDVHNGIGAEGLGGWFMERTLGLMCPSVTTTTVRDDLRIQRIRNVQEGMIEIWKKQINLLNAEYNAKKINFAWVESPRDLTFTADDMAPDCFHPSAKGHERIANEVLKAYPEL